MDAVVGVAVVGIGLSLMLPVFGQVKDDSRMTACAANLRVLSQAAFAYRNDFNGKLFLEVPMEKAEDPTRLWDRPKWWDKNQIGAYLENVDEALWEPVSRTPGDDSGESNRRSAGMTKGAMQCPADNGAVRSYHFNLWAGSADLTGAWWSGNGIPVELDGLESPNRYLIFGEAYSVLRVYYGELLDNSWSTFHDFGKQFTQVERFVGVANFPKKGFHNPGGSELDIETPRFQGRNIATEIDWLRHGDRRSRSRLTFPSPTDASNVGVADGSVKAVFVRDIYSVMQSELTGSLLWHEIVKD